MGKGQQFFLFRTILCGFCIFLSSYSFCDRRIVKYIWPSPRISGFSGPISFPIREHSEQLESMSHLSAIEPLTLSFTFFEGGQHWFKNHFYYNALMRFISWRGELSDIHSDNRITFIGTKLFLNRQLRQFLSENKDKFFSVSKVDVSWYFIPA